MSSTELRTIAFRCGHAYCFVPGDNGRRRVVVQAKPSPTEASERFDDLQCPVCAIPVLTAAHVQDISAYTIGLMRALGSDMTPSRNELLVVNEVHIAVEQNTELTWGEGDAGIIANTFGEYLMRCAWVNILLRAYQL